MPIVLQYVSAIIPAKYFIIIEKAIMLKGTGWESVSWPATVLAIMMCVLMSIALKNFKVRYK